MLFFENRNSKSNAWNAQQINVLFFAPTAAPLSAPVTLCVVLRWRKRGATRVAGLVS
jgi:hypothetical protein